MVFGQVLLFVVFFFLLFFFDAFDGAFNGVFDKGAMVPFEYLVTLAVDNRVSTIVYRCVVVVVVPL